MSKKWIVITTYGDNVHYVNSRLFETVEDAQKECDTRFQCTTSTENTYSVAEVIERECATPTPQLETSISETLHLLETTLTERMPMLDNPFDVLDEAARINDNTVHNLCLAMIGLKLARLKHGVSEDDSLLDIAGYAILALAHRKENEDRYA